MDVFNKCRESAKRTDPMHAAGVYPYYRMISSAQEPLVVYQGQELVMLGSNNYLGLTNHPEVKEAAAMALAIYGTGCAGSRLLNGTLDLHVQLEHKLAQFMGREATLSFATGFQVNIGVLSCLLERQDIAILDALDHASIIDGARLGFGRTHKFRHNDMEDLEKKLAHAKDDKGKLVVVDGVFSMEGDLAPLPQIVKLAKQYGARVMVDDAHGLGVFGQNGRGTPEHFDVERDVDLVMGTFSKSLATVGGFIAGDQYVIDHIKHSARAGIFNSEAQGNRYSATNTEADHGSRWTILRGLGWHQCWTGFCPWRYERLYEQPCLHYLRWCQRSPEGYCYQESTRH